MCHVFHVFCSMSYPFVMRAWALTLPVRDAGQTHKGFADAHPNIVLDSFKQSLL